MPDANDDGLGDAVVGAFGEYSRLGYEDSGRAYIFYSPFDQTLVRTADLNNDARVNGIDLLEFFRQYRGYEKQQGMGSADLNADGFIDDWDLFLFEWHWGPDGLW
jgi:hypothetical protein